MRDKLISFWDVLSYSSPGDAYFKVFFDGNSRRLIKRGETETMSACLSMSEHNVALSGHIWTSSNIQEAETGRWPQLLQVN